MGSEKCWITLAVIAAISSQNSAKVQFQYTSEHRKNDTLQEIKSPDSENITEFFSNAFRISSSQVLFETILADSMKSFLPSSSTNKDCLRDGLQYQTGLKYRTQWAIQMYEASAKYPSSDMELGNFDQCMSASSDSLGIRGAYALVRMQFRSVDDEIVSEPLSPNLQRRSKTIMATVDTRVKTFDNTTMPMPVGSLDLLWALCFPDSCTNEDVETSVRSALIPALTKRYLVAIEVTVSPSTYTSRHTMAPVTNPVLFACGIFVLGLALVTAGTAYDWLKELEKDTFLGSTVRAFSVTRNMKNLITDSENEFAVTNGMKTIGVLIVILGHRIAVDLGTPTFNLEYPKHFTASFWLSFMKATVSLEIFFVLSGFFMYIMIEKRLRNGKPLKFIHALVYRIARILPMYVTAMVIFAFFLPYMGDGPMWKLVIYPEAENCRKNWWTNLLFINNYVNSKESCMMVSWYLACDIHFFIIGVILTYIIWRWKTIGIGIFGVLFAASIYIPAKYIYDNKQWGVMEFSYSNLKNVRAADHFDNVYIKSHNRITPYFIGMATAYIYLKMKNSNLKISPKSRTIGIIISTLLISACYIVTGIFYLPNQAYNPWHHLLYFTFQRIVFSLVVSYVLVVGSLSNFGFISSIFECKLAVFVSRLSYVVYLVHFIVQLQSIGQIRQPIFQNFWSLYWRINSDVITTIFHAFLLNFIVEAPFRKIFQHIMDILTKNEREIPNSDIHRETENRMADKTNIPINNIAGSNPATGTVFL